MSEALDRKIAELVMGEPEPQEPILEDGTGYPYRASGATMATRAWQVVLVGGADNYQWQPLPFSTDLDQAMRAVDKAHERVPFMLRAHYWPSGGERIHSYSAESMPADVRKPMMQKGGSTLPEAICNLLLALTGEAREEEEEG